MVILGIMRSGVFLLRERGLERAGNDHVVQASRHVKIAAKVQHIWHSYEGLCIVMRK